MTSAIGRNHTRRRRPPFVEWPVTDQTAWETALARRQSFEGARLARLSPATLKKYQGAYARWLSYLTWIGELDATLAPHERVTQDRAATYVDEMRALGNRGHTILGNINDLCSALSIMVPDIDFSWLKRPGGQSLRARLTMQKRPFEVFHSRRLYHWGLELMRKAETLTGSSRRCVMMRDGLMIAMLACRGMRLRSVFRMRLGRNLIATTGKYRVKFEATDIKTRRPIEYLMPASLTPYIDRYLTKERVELLAGSTSDALWINWGGEQLGYRGVDKRIRWRSEKKFGKAFGPHRFRYGVGTTGPISDPTSPGVSAAMLGISDAVLDEHYNLAGQTEAAERFHRELARERKDTAGAAARHFAERHETIVDVLKGR